MSNRRNFLKILSTGTVSLFIPKIIEESPWQKKNIEIPTFSEILEYQNQEELTISNILKEFLSEGKQQIDSFIQGAYEPIRIELKYQEIGRRLINIESLPQGFIARYEKDVFSVSNVCNISKERFAHKSS